MSNSFEIVKDRLRLTDVVEEDLNTKRSGKVLKAQCPFHDDSTPSFTIYPNSQSFHCFGCGKSGTIIDYVMYREGLKESYEAVEYIAEEYNIEIPGFNKEAMQAKRSKINNNRNEAIKALKEKNIKAGDFLQERGFNKDTTYHFGIGFNYERNAIQIPYLDTYGNIVGFAFRNMDEDKPKYINSSEDNVFKKSELLFGLDKARHHITDKIFIVEGYFDVMAMWQMGYKETVAYCGSGISKEQVNLLSKYINKHTKILLFPDNDKTGIKQVAENVRLFKSKVKNPIGVLELPEGIKDANDILKLGITIERFESVHHEIFLLKQELDKCLEQTDEYEVAREFATYTKNEMIRSEMANLLADRWDKPKEVVMNHMQTKEEIKDYDFDLKDFSFSLSEYQKQLEEGSEGRVYFNLDHLDSTVKGMKKGEVCFLMGRSGSGKTTMALNLIHNAIMKQGHNTMFSSLELLSENVVPQLMQIHLDETEGKIANKVRKEELDDQEYFINQMNKRLKIVDAPGQTVDDIERYALLANKYFDKPIRLLVIDYFGYIKTTGYGDYNEKSNIARKMKELAKKLDCLVFVLSQTSRDGGSDGSTPVSLDSARDTGAIEETGDYVLGVYRPAVNSQLGNNERLALQHEYYCQVLKNRWGSLGTSKLHFEPMTKRIENWKE